MMLKVMVYAYMDNIYSSRKIEKAMRENINFMWLSAQQVVDHNTIARFRSNRLKDVFKDIFKQVVMLLAEEGLVKLKEVYTDGTKIEFVTGCYTFVWGKSINNYKENISRTMEPMSKYAQYITDDEDERNPNQPSINKISYQKIKKTVEKMEQII